MKTSAVVLAAGESRRMGADKLVLPYHGERLLYRALAPYLCSARIDEVLLVVQPGFTWPDEPAGCRLIENPYWAEGMGTSLAAGIAAADAAADTYLLALGDMPGLRMATLGSLLDARQSSDRRIVRPSYRGRPGHPVLFDRVFRERLLELGGDIGARQLLREQAADVLQLGVDDPGVVHDIDTPADYLRFLCLSDIRVLVRGAGEMASATAHRLFQCGFRVVMTEIEQPTAIRRQVSFATAIQQGRAEVEGVTAIGYRLDQAAKLDSFDGAHIPVFVDPEAELASLWQPQVLIDARLLKRATGSVSDAPLVIGLGPGFRTGIDAHLVVETNRGHDLARLITSGTAAANTGQPGLISGCSDERVLRAPASGRFEAACEIGDQLAAGDLAGSVNGRQIRVAVSGVVRGLIHPGYLVRQGQKIGDIDPRCQPSYCTTISEKARAISGTCLHAILSNMAHPGPDSTG